MAASILDIAGQKWVVELLWQTETGRKARANAKVAAKTYGDDLMCTRLLPAANYGASAIQVGLASTRDIGKNVKAIPSLAGALATMRGGSWIGAFALPTGYFYALVIKDDAILASGGDKLFSTEKDLLQYVNGQLKVADWDCVVSGVTVEGAETIDLLAFLSSSRSKAPQLKLIGSRIGLPDNFPMARVVQVGLIVVFAAIYFWPETKQQSALPVTNVKAPPPPPPWPNMPAPSAWLSACASQLEAMPSAVGGWEFASLVCNGPMATVQFKRTKLGTLSDMLSVGAMIGQDGRAATMAKPMAIANSKGNEPQRDMGIRSLLIDAVETQGDRIEARVTPAALPGSQPTNQEPPTWQEITFQIQTSADIRAFGWLDRIPGVRMMKISYTPAETPAYKMEGVIYVNK